MELNYRCVIESLKMTAAKSQASKREGKTGEERGVFGTIPEAGEHPPKSASRTAHGDWSHQGQSQKANETKELSRRASSLDLAT